MSASFKYGTDLLSIAGSIALLAKKQKGIIDDDAKTGIIRSQEYVNKIVESHETVYGINTGFGILSNKKI